MLVVRKAGAWDDPVNRDDADSLTASEMGLVEMLLGSWSYVIGAAASAAVVSAIIRGDADAVSRALGWDRMTGALAGLPEALSSEVVAAANATNLGPQLNLSGAFDVTDPRAIAWAQRRAGQLIVEITDQQRGLVRNLITEALRDGITVDATAARVRQVVGLTDRYAQAVTNSRARTFESLLKAGLNPAQAAARADQLADAYRQRLLQSRATTIARTEILAASNQGRYLAWQQGVEEGLIHPDSVKEWRTAPAMSRYGPPCVHCLPYNGIRTRWDQPFSNGAMMPPLHPNCRCTAVILPPDKGVTDQGQLGDGEGWEDDGQTFAGTRCDLCPGNCGRRYPVNVRVIKALTACSGLPGSAPENAVPVKSVEEVDPGDVIYFDGSTGGEQGVTVVGPGSKPGTLKVKSAASKGSTYDLNLLGQIAKGKKYGLVPGPVKVAKAQAFDGTPGAPLPPFAPVGSIPVTKNSQVHPGDILYTSKQKNAQGYEVLGIGPNGGILYYSPGAKKKFEIDLDSQAGKTAFGIAPGPNKAQHVLGTLGPDAKPAGPSTVAGGDPNPTMWQPKPYRYSAYAGGNGGTVEIVSISPSGQSAVVKQYVDGNFVEFTVDTKDLLGVPTASKFMHHGQPKEVASVSGPIVKFTDGTQTTFGDGALVPISSSAHKKLNEPPQVTTPAPVDPPSTPNPLGTLKPTEGEYLPPFTDSFDLLGVQTGGPTGSNTGKPGGFWTGKDGKKYYVKAYSNPEQAFQEMLANRLYGAAGVKAPRTTLSTWTDPDTGKEKVLIATEIIDNKGTVGSLGLTSGRAKSTVEGFAADAWLANFDAVGTGLDNIVVLADGTIARIDAGGSLLFRAQGSLKVKDPKDLHEVDLGAFFTQNQYYKQVLTKAGYKSPDDLDLTDQVALLRKTVDEAGGTKKIVEDLYEQTWKEANLLGLPLPLKPDLDVLADLLEARLKSLEKKYPSTSPVTGKKEIQVGSTLGDIDVADVQPGLLLDANGKMQYLISDVAPDGSITVITVSGSGKAIGTDKFPQKWLTDLKATSGGKSWKVLATDAPVPRGWEPKVGYIVSHADYPDSSYKVVAFDPATGKVTIESKTGKTFDADVAKVVQLKEGTPVYVGGVKHKVVTVEGDSVVLLDGSKVQLAQIGPATHTGGTYPGETPAARRTTTPTQTTGGPWPDATVDPLVPAEPDTLGVVPKGFTRPDNASAEALANPQKGAYVAWDGGDVEGLEVRMTGVKIGGEDHTEVRFKLTAEAKTRLEDLATRSGAWTRDDVVYVHAVDPVTREVRLERGSSASREDGVTFSYISSGGSTYVRTLDDGTRVVFTVSGKGRGATAFDGQVRIFKRGGVSEDDMAEIMRQLHVGTERNRYPARPDVEALAENKILNLFARSETRQGKLTGPVERQQALARIKQTYGVGPEDLEMVPGPNGAVEFLLPKKIAADIKKRTKTTAFYSDLTGTGSVEDQIFKILTNPRQTMMSTTQRRLEGVVTGSMSQSSDIGTGGADYVFTRQAGRATGRNGRIVWKSDNLFRRVDWYSYESDSYGTLLPGSAADRVDPLSAVAYHGGSRETMFRHHLSFEDATIYVDARTRDRLLQRLRDAGITEVSGVPIEKLIVATR